MENNEKSTEKDNEALTSKVRLKPNDRNGEFRPFVVNHLSNSSLKPIINCFENSKEIELGYSTITKDKGTVKPTLKKKNLYLTGGALRDHLKNKTFSTYDCVTDASPDEIRLILTSKFAEIEEVKPDSEDIQIQEKYKKLPAKNNKKKIFYASRWDAQGNEMEFTVEVNDQKIHLSPFSLNVKNRMLTPKQVRFVTTLEEDSMSRDLTMDSLYLKLRKNDGENSELLDPQGGAYDLKNGLIVTVKPAEKAFSSDPYLPYRLANLSARFANDGMIPPDLVKIIENLGEVEGVKRHNLRKYFISSVENLDVPCDLYLRNLKEAYLAEKMFPGLKIYSADTEVPNNRLIACAYLLQDNMPEKVSHVLTSMGWNKLDIENIVSLIQIATFAKNSYNPELIYNLFAKPMSMTNSVIKDFLKTIKKIELYNKIFSHDFSEIMKKYIERDGKREINPKYIRFAERVPRTEELEDIRKKLFVQLVKGLL